MPGAERAELPRAAGARPLRDRRRVGARQAAPATRCARGRPSRADPARSTSAARALAQHAVELADRRAAACPPCRRRPARAARSRARAARARSPSSDRGQRQREQAHAAVDVVADAARRDDAVRELGRRDAADREAVALVDVGHRQRRLDDPRQRRHVLQLLERAVAERSPRAAPRSAKTRAGTRMSGRASAGISQSVSSRRTSSVAKTGATAITSPP